MMKLIDIMDSVGDHNFASEEENGEEESGGINGKDCSPVSPMESVVSGLMENHIKVEEHRSYLHDHNYASVITPAAIMPSNGVVTGQEGGNEWNCEDNDVGAQWKCEDGADEELDQEYKICDAEYSDQNTVVSIAVGTQTEDTDVTKEVVAELQMANNVATAEREIERLTKLLDEQGNNKTEFEKGFAKIQSSVTNVCCGLTVFIEEFRKKLNAWCISNGVEEQEKVRFQTEIDSIAGLIQRKLKLWLEDGLIQQLEWNTVKETIDEASQRVQEKIVATTEECTTVRLVDTSTSKHPEPTTAANIVESACSLKNESKVPKDENGVIGKGQHKDVSKNGAFVCTCGYVNRNKIGLKCHIRMLSKRKRKFRASKLVLRDGNGKATTCKKIRVPLVTNDSALSSSTAPSVRDKQHEQVIKTPTPLPMETMNIKLKNPEMMKLVNSLQPRVVITRLSTVGLAFNSSPNPPSTPVGTGLSSPLPTPSPTEDFSLDESFKSFQEEKLECVLNSRKVSKRVHGVNPKSKQKCLCGMTFAGKHLLNKHVQYYLLDRNFPCKSCPRSFTTERNLWRHCRSAHKVSQRTTTANTADQQKILTATALESTSPVIKTKRDEALPMCVNFHRLVSKKKRRDASKRKRKLLRITARERIFCQCCYRRFPHLRDLTKHMARRIHGREAIQSRYGKGQKRRCTSTGSSIQGSSTGTSIASETGSQSSCNDTPSTLCRRSTRFQKVDPVTNPDFANQSEPTSSNSMASASGKSSNNDAVLPKKLKTRKAKGKRCICDRRCNQIANQKGAIPPHCTICEMRFGCLELLQNHFLRRHNIRCEVPKVCDKCYRTFDTKQQLAEHLKNKHTKANSSTPKETTQPVVERKPQKPVSSKPSSSKAVVTNYKGHYHRVGGQGSLKKHFRTKTLGKIFTCTYCKVNFSTNSNLNRHLRGIHGVNMKNFGCSSCGKTFGSSSECIAHHRKAHVKEFVRRQIPKRK